MGFNDWRSSRRRGRLPRSFAAGVLALLLALGGGGLGVVSASGSQHASSGHAVSAKSAASAGVTLRYEVGARTLDPGTSFGFVKCRKAFHAVGGGFKVEDPRVQVMQSTPYNSSKASSTAPPANAWFVIFNNTAPSKQTVRIYVVCLAGTKVAVK